MKNKKRIIKLIIMILISLFLILTGLISWHLYFSKYQTFADQEKLFLDEAKHYYSLNYQYLPNKGETREITLQDLYDFEYINDLYIPKTRKLCDSSSWVRVYQKEDGSYEYIVYLKCGKYESKTDHIGPEITLNGSSQVVLSLNSSYEELGVNNVEDNIDGKIDPSKVIIDSSKVDTTKLGSYEVTYTVKDSNYNKTVLIRTVIVANNLTEIVKKATDDTGYYKGLDQNNYLLYSGMLFRIVNVNEDGSIKLISDEAITNLDPSYDNYENSNVDTWLKEIYLNSLKQTDKYLVNSTYCVGNIKSISEYSDECSSTITAKVGLLSISDYYKTLAGNNSSISTTRYMLANKVNGIYLSAPIKDKDISITTEILAPIRPVITLKSNLYLLTGDGSSTNPYKLDDYQYALANDLLNTRLIGEYIKYSGLTFRIMGIDENKNVRVIMASPWIVQPKNKELTLSINNLENTKFNLNDINNPGYILNNNYIDYIDTTSIIDTNYEIPTITDNTNYKNYETTSITAKILLPKTYDLFTASGNDKVNKASSYMYIDSTNNPKTVYAVNGANGNVFEFNNEAMSEYKIRAVLTLKGSLKISSGKGTVNSPYLLK